MNKTIKNQELWIAQSIVKPKIDWKNFIKSFEFNNEERIVLEKQLPDGTEFSITVMSGDDRKAEKQAKHLLKSFLALVGLESGAAYNVMIKSLFSLTRGVYAYSDSYSFKIRVMPKEDFDFPFLKKANEFIKNLDTNERDRIVNGLSFLYDAINAHSDEHAFLSLYGGLNYLAGYIAGKGRRGVTEATAVLKFVDKGILDLKEGLEWVGKFDEFHRLHYDILLGREKISLNEVKEIKSFFQEFFGKALEYLTRS
jgi:hypothetical protein